MTPEERLAEALEQLTRTTPASTARVATLDRLRALSESLLSAEVEAARQSGVTWAAIGSVLGVTRQAAFQRFGTRKTDERAGPMQVDMLTEAPARAQALIELLVAERYDAAREVFDPTLADALDANALAEAWTGIGRSFGRLESTGDPVVLQTGEVVVCEMRLELEAGSVTLRTAWNTDGTLAGLYFVPVTE
ncbi:uncharacterized protein DUF3887 [Sediminihabitans luteus]|uniref:Uncharacterized protein DUF3887 n=1 Tax=Sediminihabitans luteus TaxID=1138585 RepID=A0A2M9CZP4_9CELL|nr:DUF3887 domain-containing protein [Sediminihabitans luteus]PJJ77402.1 uncharacterized protein DUF3887 [Sediminihabitans luteus]GII98295.1 hypothetical protein Slu03_06730 [Sediminihabitans luteus]